MAYRKTPAIRERLRAQKQAIIEAGIDVLVKHGKAQFTTPRVFEAAGVSNGTLYNYFPDANELWIAVVKTCLARDLETMRQAGLDAIHPVASLARVISAFYGCLERPRLARAMGETAIYRRGIRTELEAALKAAGSPARARQISAAAIMGALYGLAEVEAPEPMALAYCLKMLELNEVEST